MVSAGPRADGSVNFQIGGRADRRQGTDFRRPDNAGRVRSTGPPPRTTMTLSRRLLYAAPIAVLAAIGVILVPTGESAPSPADAGKQPEKVADLKPAVSLPISQVILFNSGVGHFTRSGEVEGDARVDL